MRPFFWKTVICLTPVLLSAWVTWNAWMYDRFKMGVDLQGGTILVYEIDTRKQQERAGTEGRYSAAQDTNLLADSLKRRIDPTATYNIVIRPAGGEGRVEIILPTGGEQRARKAQDAWDTLLAKMKTRWGVKDLEVSRGHLQELVERIQVEVAEHVWESKLFSTPKAWDDLLTKAQNRWLQLSPLTDARAIASVIALEGSPGAPRPLVVAPAYVARVRMYQVPIGKLPQLINVLYQELKGDVPEKTIESWVKEQAWKDLLSNVQKEWPELAKNKAELESIPPDSFEELIGRVEAKGSVIGQASLRTLEPLLGPQPVKTGVIDRTKVTRFIEENYGPSPRSIEESIAETGPGSGRTKDLTVEEVQRIKDLVAKVGSLEFRILANQVDDKQAIEDGKKYIESANVNQSVKDELEKVQVRGEPPPGPRVDLAKPELKRYTISLPHNNKSIVTYSWVEIGPQERRALGLDNAAKNDAESRRKSIWDQVNKAALKNQAVQIVEPTSSDKRFTLQGALYFRRDTKDRNLPEEERRRKQYDYFVLTRNPEIDPETGKETPKIDGSYLVSAVSHVAEGRPTVSFTFNSTGGDLFGKLTRKNVPSGTGTESDQVRRHLAIILDGLVMSAPTINSEIRQHGQISGSFTRREVDNLVNILRSGALPATLKPQPVSESTMGATLGQDTISMGVHAIVLAFVAVVLFMIAYYRFAGLVACIALFANLLLTIGFMVAVQATFTLPGLAGLVLMLGMAVDANVLIYERLREERDRGASLALAIRNGYDRAFPTIIDTHLSSIFTAIVLYVVGNDQLKGFGVTLTVGLVISLFTSLYMTRLMFDIWLHNGWLHKLSMARFLSKTDFDFMRVRYFWFTATVALTILGLALFIGRLPTDLNIDFVGGTAYGGQLVHGKAMTIEELRHLLEEPRQKEMLKVVAVQRKDAEGREFEITYQEPNGKTSRRSVLLANKAAGETREEQEQNLKERAGILPDWSVEQIFPSFAKEEDPDKSRYFTVRASEKETELVQGTVDRLLREPDKTGELQPLLLKIQMVCDPAQLENRGKETRIKLTFTEYGSPDKIAFASPSFVKTLLTRELLKQFKVSDRSELPFHFELSGEGKGKEGRFAEMKLTFAPELNKDQAGKVKAALASTEQEFEDRPQPERLENFDSELAAETRLRAMWAILASWGAILLYLWFRFGNWTFGLAAVLCLMHDLFFTLGIIAAAHYLHGTWLGNALLLEDFKLDLTAVAALLTLVGYSVNDTIVVFDRISEVRGKNPDLTAEMINDSVNQTLSRTLLTSGITWLVVFVLYVWGGPGLRLFAFVMVVGVIVGTYSSIYVASPLLLIFGEGHRSAGRGQRQPQTTGVTA